MTRHPARRSRMIAAAAVVVALMALGATVAMMAGKPDAVEPIALDKLTEIERLAPRDTSQLVLTPGVGQDNKWWKTVVAFMPARVGLGDLKPTSDLGITHLGYSFSAADPALRLDLQYARMLYVETDSVEHARKVQRWLSTSKGAASGAFSTSINGRTIVLATSDIPLSAALPKNGAGLGSTVMYRRDTAKRDDGSLIWEDWGAYVKAAGASSGKPAEYSQFFHGATGFIKGSRWVGYSTSPDVGWSGKFQSGGMDPKLVSAGNVAKAINSYSKVLAKGAQGNPGGTQPQPQLTVSNLGAGVYLRHGFYARHPSLKGPQATIGSADLAFKPRTDGDTAFSFDPSSWLAGTSRTGGARPEGLSLFAYSINDNTINLKVTITPRHP